MQRFRASSFASAVGVLQRAGLLLTIAGNSRPFEVGGEDRKSVIAAIAEAKPPIAELPLSRVLRSQFERLVKYAENATPDVLATLLAEFNNNLMVEVSAAWFLMIPEDQRELYEQRSPPFHADVLILWPDAGKDVAAASRCLALDEWTACVFHLMRVLEHGLRAVAGEVGLQPESMAHENWKNIIDQIESQIRGLEKAPKTPEKIERIRVLSAAATQFRYFKDAWRNHVSHAHAHYDERDAETIWTHVKSFMEQTASSLRSRA